MRACVFSNPRAWWIGIGLPEGFELIPPVSYSGAYVGTGTPNPVWADLSSAAVDVPGLTWYGLQGSEHAPIEVGQGPRTGVDIVASRRAALRQVAHQPRARRLTPGAEGGIGQTGEREG